jgi:hypothetical protein
MKIRSFIPLVLIITAGILSITGCQKGNLVDNPNLASTNSTIPASLVLNHLTATTIRSAEQPWGDAYKTDQYFVSNYQYYRGTNFYTFGNTNDSYDILKYAIALEQQSTKQLGNQTNKYYAIAQFYKAYAYVWLSQRVGDIPASQAGSETNLTPKFDTQHDVYQLSLSLLDKANSILGALNATPSVANAALDGGDIYGLTSLQWQKVVNAFHLRVLISLSKRATDNADLQVPQQFAAIVNNPAQYPLMVSNADNMLYKYNAAFNPYPIYANGNSPYNNFANISKTYLDITTANQDPRTFATSTPAPAQIAAGKLVSDFTAYVGADINVAQPALLTSSNNGAYSFTNYNRYYTSNLGANAEPYVLISYAEMCFNIAEGINRGWVTGPNSTTWYNNGINASLSFFGLTNGQVYTVADLAGKTIGTTVINIPQFLANANVVYMGDNANGLAQILTQKYIALFDNSGYEAYYNYRRTGIPAFAQGGVGIGTPNNLIPRRWMYPALEITYNPSNYQSSISSQFGGTDDLFKDTWLTK